MQVFLMHVGHPGHIDIDYTIKRQRSSGEILKNIPRDSPERDFFENGPAFSTAFPTGNFHCWGVPPKAKPAFEDTNVGDLILFAPWIGIQKGGNSSFGNCESEVPEKSFFSF